MRGQHEETQYLQIVFFGDLPDSEEIAQGFGHLAVVDVQETIMHPVSCKNLYFLPFSQDDYIKKPNSLVADFEKLPDAAIAAFEGRQLQPVLGF